MKQGVNKPELSYLYLRSIECFQSRLIPNCIMKSKFYPRRTFIGDQIDVECPNKTSLYYQLPFQKVRKWTDANIGRHAVLRSFRVTSSIGTSRNKYGIISSTK